MFTTLQAQLDASCSVIQSLAELTDTIDHIAARVRDALLDGHMLLTCGNGGSATDAQHLAEELTGLYRANRRALPAIALTADTAALTCIANDFGYEQVFARQVEALARPGDLLLCFSTSGNSPNILAALAAARTCGAYSIAVLGKNGGAARELADLPLVVASADTARIQEAHLQILHYICEVVEGALAPVGE
jgi:D-sedoheptulose 7-phosphate isomerase